MSERIIGPSPAIGPLRLSGSAEVIRDRMKMERRREALWNHNPNAINLAAAAMAAAAIVVNGDTPEVRCEMSKRMRGFMFEGAEKMETADLAAMALENALGYDAVIEWGRVFFGELGQELQPKTVAPGATAEAQAALVRDEAQVQLDIIEGASPEKLKADLHKLQIDAMRMEGTLHAEQERATEAPKSDDFRARAAARFAEHEQRRGQR